MVKISVVIPVYNVGKYLRECLEHIVSQSFRDIEIICINDGSTDNSLDILNEFAKKDNRIIIISQKNQGLGAVRNRGIQLANGEYIYFMDGDDYLKPNALKELYEISNNLNPDFIIFKIDNFNESTGKRIDDDYYNMPYLKKLVGKNIFNYDDVKGIALKLAVNIPGNFYKREFIKDLKFPEGLLFEDNVFFTKALFKAKRIYFHDKFLYKRRVRDNSLSNSFSISSLDTIDITDMLLDLINEYGYEYHKPQLYYRIFNNIYKIFEDAPDDCKKDLFFEMKNRYLKFTPKWENDDYFINELPARFRNIYESAILSDSPDEFELRVKLYEKQNDIDRLKKENRKIKRDLRHVQNENKRIKSTKGYKYLKL